MKETFNHADHPCFNQGVSKHYGRVHLAVAPGCNIRCNYCNRRFDCANEGRPGVTSRLLSPMEALRRLEAAMSGPVPISVAGIAGPGDPLANPDATFRTLELVRRKYPQLLLCLSTNGLMAVPFLREILGAVSHITLTINAVDAGIGARIYQWVRLGSRMYTGIEAAGTLLERQLEAIQLLKRAGMVVKVNTVMIPGVNDVHVTAVAEKMAALSVDVFNAMPLFPVEGTPFAHIRPPTGSEMRALRAQAREHLPQMSHCARCRADAAGLIGHEQPVSTEECAPASESRNVNKKCARL